MYFENSRAHGTLCTKCQASDKSDLSDLSDILCPQYRHCTMRSASRWECALFSGERHAHGAGVRHLAGRARSHVLWNFRGTGHPHSPVPIVRTSPYKSVQVRIPLPAPCALHNVPCQSSGGSRARQGDSRQSPGGTFAAKGFSFPPCRQGAAVKNQLIMVPAAVSPRRTRRKASVSLKLKTMIGRSLSRHMVKAVESRIFRCCASASSKESSA